MDMKLKFLLGAVVMATFVAGAGLLTMYISLDVPDTSDGTSDVDQKVTENRGEIWRGNRAESNVQPGFASETGFNGLESPEKYADGVYYEYYIDTNLEYEEVMNIALSQQEIQDFITGINGKYEAYAWFDDYDDSWIVDIYPWNYWDAFAYCKISDSTGDVLEIFTWNGKDLDITREEIMEIVLEHPIVQEFLNTYPDAQSYMYYEFFGFWSINFYHEERSEIVWKSSLDFENLYVVFDAVSQEILEIYSSFAPSTLNLNENSVMAIALAEPEIAEFVEDHPDYFSDLGVYIHYGEDQYTIWYLNFQTYSNWGIEGDVTATGVPTDEAYYGFWDYSYAYLSIDDATGDILYMEVYSWQEATLTEDQVLDIAGSTVEVQEFLTAFPDAEVNSYYDYYGEWKVYYYVPYFWNAWVHVTIEDETGDVLYVDSYIPDQFPEMTYNEVVELVMSTPEAQNFTEKFPDASLYVYYNIGYTDYAYTDASGVYREDGNYIDTKDYDDYNQTYITDTGSWFAELSNSGGIYADNTDPAGSESKPSSYSVYEAWYFVIDDISGEIINKEYYIENWWWPGEYVEATMTEAEVLEVVNSVPEIVEFLEQVPGAEVYAYYDYYGSWYVSYYSPHILDAWAFVGIQDSTGDVLYVEVYIGEPPQMTYDEVADLILSTPEAQNFTAHFPNASIYAFYYDGYWEVELTSEDYMWFFNGTEEPDYYEKDKSLEHWWFTVDDATGEIIKMAYYHEYYWFLQATGEVPPPPG
ncbi:MAG: hypothetical protein JSV04_15020 [Candidatus Heimdallarchaeota archaeon]|nr:MAG: hypothetical protein JSV04_15020 [Candidatus Heimdallarchaeota archaeon]